MNEIHLVDKEGEQNKKFYVLKGLGEKVVFNVSGKYIESFLKIAKDQGWYYITIL